MKRYKQLTIEQRYQIYGLKKAGFDQSEISGELKVNKSTISRELKRNVGERGWRPRQAQEKARERRLVCKNANRFSPEDWIQVDLLIRERLSPEQVSGRMAFERLCRNCLLNWVSNRHKCGQGGVHHESD